MADNKKVVGFKKFSEIKGKSKIEEIDPSLPVSPETDGDRPMNPNLSKDSNRVERLASRKNIIPQDQNLEVDEDEDSFINDIDTTPCYNMNLIIKKITTKKYY